MTAFILRDYAPSLALYALLILGGVVWMAATGRWGGNP